ncbi:MAG: hypothetical protein QOF17_315, partial [Solirubrobacteraceae bacterium]|nr:hypothetical protein [Solirubrobacteraceae bacterium]
GAALGALVAWRWLPAREPRLVGEDVRVEPAAST